MNPILFISKHILKTNKKDLSANIVKIALATIILGVIVMLLSVFIVTGFKHKIERKVSGFVGNIRISNLDYNESYETNPIEIDSSTVDKIWNIHGVKGINQYVIKAGIIKTEDKIEGIIFKGVGDDMNFSNFSGDIIEGKIPHFQKHKNNDSILISKIIADKLNLSLNDKIDAYFLYEENPRVRRMIIAGVYESGFGDYDKTFVIADINIIRQLNNWSANMSNGYEIYVNKFPDQKNISLQILDLIPYNCKMQTAYDINPQVFDWLSLQDVNVVLLLSIMGIVCVITMIAVLLIIVIERTSMIGVLKALGMKNGDIKKIFIVKAAYIVGIGTIIGTIVAIILALLQINFNIITLPQESYYVKTVPMEINPVKILGLDILIFIVCMAFVYIPTALITRIKPISIIRYE